jgi:hypothetical protein
MRVCVCCCSHSLCFCRLDSDTPRAPWIQSICRLCVTLLELMDGCEAFVNMVMMSMMSDQDNFETAEISKKIITQLGSFLRSVVADPAFFDYFQVGPRLLWSGFECGSLLACALA